MKHILAREHRDVLAQFAWSRLLVALDYDGTLAPIVADPEDAVMRPTTRCLLAELTELYPCSIISGRAQTDARQRLAGVRVDGVIGNHGMEPLRATRGFLEEVQRWRPLLEERLGGMRGVQIEDKVFSVALHYRHARDKRKARAAILAAASALGDVRVVGGKLVVNLVPRGAPHKGIALERERERLKCDTALYVGDDETDEDVFALDQPGRLLTIRVGAKRSSLASFCIRDQREIDRLLRALVDLRKNNFARARARA